MEKIQKHFTLKNLIEFIKLQLAGNILFWGTMGGSFVGAEWLHWSDLRALVTASILAHIAFFIVDKEWVFNSETGQQKTAGEVVRFALFMGLNFFINIGIVMATKQFLGPDFVVDPLYVGQFAAGVFFTFWTYLGLKFWVFHDTHAHSLLVKRRPRRGRRTRKATK